MTDWQPGDLALCVNRGVIVCEGENHTKCQHEGTDLSVPPLMSVRTVESLHPALSYRGSVMECGCYALRFTDGSEGVHKRFVKVTPGADIEGKEVERKVPKPAATPTKEGIRI